MKRRQTTVDNKPQWYSIRVPICSALNKTIGDVTNTNRRTHKGKTPDLQLAGSKMAKADEKG